MDYSYIYCVMFLQDIADIVETLSRDGICQKDSSGKEILESLFVEYKKLFERLSQVVDGGNAEEKSSQATIQVTDTIICSYDFSRNIKLISNHVYCNSHVTST